jgi:hypothetical protein
MNTYLIVLDFNQGIPYCFTLTDAHKAMDSDELLNLLGFRPKDCHWMYTSEEVDFQNSADYND